VNTRLVQLQQRIHQLETVAEEIVPLVERYYQDDHSADRDLSLKGQQWYGDVENFLRKTSYRV
jgi:hypothetical protein